MVICLERGADLHMAQLMPLPLNVSCFSKIQIGVTFLVPAHPGSPGQRAVKQVCVYSLELGTGFRVRYGWGLVSGGQMPRIRMLHCAARCRFLQMLQLHNNNGHL